MDFIFAALMNLGEKKGASSSKATPVLLSINCPKVEGDCNKKSEVMINLKVEPTN